MLIGRSRLRSVSLGRLDSLAGAEAASRQNLYLLATAVSVRTLVKLPFSQLKAFKAPAFCLIKVTLSKNTRHLGRSYSARYDRCGIGECPWSSASLRTV
jgi:hypothetical protein